MMSHKKPRIAVVSPFLDKQHGTERCIVEQLEGLADEFEFHVYSGRVSDLDLRKIVWHHIPLIPGPHLAQYIWFFGANHLCRWVDRTFRRLTFDLTYSPGINCFDAGLISVHIVFAEFNRLAQRHLHFGSNPLRFWFTLLHRRVSYQFFIFLERRVYSRQDLPLIAVSGKVRDTLRRFYGHQQNLFIVYNGIEPNKFNPSVRQTLRESARSSMGYSCSDFVLLLIGNDWNTKGLPCLIEAVGMLKQPQIKILVVGNDVRIPFQELLEQQRLTPFVQFLPPRPDAEFFYAAADAYAGPSLADAFGIPPLEAMACGLPVIISRQSGVSELVTHGVDACILENPAEPAELAMLIRRLYEDEEFRGRLGRNAAQTAAACTWKRNAEQLRSILQKVIAGQAQAIPGSRVT